MLAINVGNMTENQTYVRESHMMEIVVLSSTPEREDVVQAPGEVIPRVGVDGLVQPQEDPDIHGDDV